MKWVEAIVTRPLVPIILSLALTIFGLFAIFYTPMIFTPMGKTTQVNVTVTYAGANAKTIQTEITQKIIQSLTGLSNIQSVSAYSSMGQASIQIQLNPLTPSERLQTQMQIIQAVNSAHIPTNASLPHISLHSWYTGLLSVTLSSKTLSSFQLENYAQRHLIPRLNALPGVILVNSTPDGIVQVNLRPRKLAYFQLSPLDIAQQLQTLNRDTPSGSLVIAGNQFTLNIPSDTNTLPKLQNLIIGYTRTATKHQVKQPIYLKQVAHITFSNKTLLPNQRFLLNRQHAFYLFIGTQTNANPLTVSALALPFLNKLKAKLPSDIQLQVPFNMATNMLASIHEVFITILISILLVIAICFLFLGQWRTTLIPLTTLPVCLLGAILLLMLFGFSINFVTLLGIVISVGLVVDDAIVVVENSMRLMQEGETRFDAICLGTQKLATTIIGITLTLLVVYFPVMFLDGTLPIFLKPFAVMLISAVLISGIVALTLTPTLCLLLLPNEENKVFLAQKFDAYFHRILCQYIKVLHCFLAAPKRTLAALIVIFALLAIYASGLPQAIIPHEPSGSININLPPATSSDFARINQALVKLEPLKQVTDAHSELLIIERDQTTRFLKGKLVLNYTKQPLTEFTQIRQKIQHWINQHAANSHATVKVQSFFTFGQFDFTVALMGTNGYHNLVSVTHRIVAHLKKSSIFSMAQTTEAPFERTFTFHINATRAAQLGVSQSQIRQLLSIDFGGFQLTNDFNANNIIVPIIIRLNEHALMNHPNILNQLMIYNQQHQAIPLSDFVSLHPTTTQSVIGTLDNMPSITIHANLAPSYSIGQAVHLFQQTLKTISPGTQYLYFGNAHAFVESNHQSLIIFSLGLVCIYLLLVLIFHSLKDPLIILTTVPFCIIGGAVALHLIGGSINVFSIIGFLTLIGLITKHGILMVQFANQSLAQEADLLKAIEAAASKRFRPIIMTTLAMVFGAVPLVLYSSIMYHSRTQLGTVVIAGLLVGTFFSLFIVPLSYRLFHYKRMF